MATIDFDPPLPLELMKLSITWVRGTRESPTPTDEGSADGAIIMRTTKAGLKNEARATIAEARDLLTQVEQLQGTPHRQPSQTTTRQPTRPPSSTASTSRSVCAGCSSARSLVGPRHIVSVEDLDGFSRHGLDGGSVVCTTTYEYECPTCHSLESFATAR